jgi:hypothetical protein
MIEVFFIYVVESLFKNVFENLTRVSTVLNKDTKSYGKQFLCDGKEETCWNSDQVKFIITTQFEI